MAIEEPGRRPLTAILDRKAQESPEQSWLSLPQDDGDLSRGFRDISYSQGANAVNHAAAWLQSVLGSTNGTFETFMYEGPKDPRNVILALAASKVGRTILLVHATVPLGSKLPLVDKSRCESILFASSSRELAEAILTERPSIRGISVPELSQWLMDALAAPVPFPKAWDDAEHDPCIIIHSSGTTGQPKPMIYTHRILTAQDLLLAIARNAGRPVRRDIAGLRFYGCIPIIHLAGILTFLTAPLVHDAVAVYPSALSSATVASSTEVLKYGHVQGIMSPPLLLREMVRDEGAFKQLKRVEIVACVGAALDKVTGDILSNHVRLVPGYGSVESGPIPLEASDDRADWAYFGFKPHQGIELEPIAPDQFELVFRRSIAVPWQQIFYLFPELDTYRSRDIFEKHPTKPGLWRFIGRTDDFLNLKDGGLVNVASMSEEYETSRHIRAALFGCASDQDRPFLLVEPAVDGDKQYTIDRAWPDVEAVNKNLRVNARVERDMVIVTDEDKPFLRTAKESVRRKETLELYRPEIDARYSLVRPSMVTPY